MAYATNPNLPKARAVALRLLLKEALLSSMTGAEGAWDYFEQTNSPSRIQPIDTA
jgi:hypothetical protein